MKIRVNCTEGIGDNLYVRPLIQRLTHVGNDVYLETALPEMYSDLPVKFLKPEGSKYRTQQKSFLQTTVKFSEPPESFDQVVTNFYGRLELKRHNIIGSMEEALGLDPTESLKYSLPLGLPPHGIKLPRKKLALIRPVTNRTEKFNASRSPNPNYISWVAKVLIDAGYYVVSVADVDGVNEWIEGDEPPAHLKLHHGELSLWQLLSLMKEAALVVTGPNFMLPAAVCAGVPLFVIFGGRGEYDNPYKLFDLRLNMHKIGWALPTNFCRCNQNNHDCDKTIADLDHQFMNFMARL